VKRLLLGNNIVTDSGAEAIAQFIASKESKLTTWYIAGNQIGVKGMTAVAQALQHNPIVDALWLKRNPLGPESCPALANLLMNNDKIQVLDLVNTGIFDAGLKTLLQACTHNRTLQHLYVGTNGLTAASGPVIGYVHCAVSVQAIYLI
jgi:hypothetical protein